MQVRSELNKTSLSVCEASSYSRGRRGHEDLNTATVYTDVTSGISIAWQKYLAVKPFPAQLTASSLAKYLPKVVSTALQ